MRFPVVLKYEFTGTERDHTRFMQTAEAYGWEDVRVYTHPTEPNRSVAASMYGMPTDMLRLLASADPLYRELTGKYRAMITEAQGDMSKLPSINNAMVQDGFPGRIAVHIALWRKKIAHRSFEDRVLKLARNYAGQMMLEGMVLEEDGQAQRQPLSSDWLEEKGRLYASLPVMKPRAPPEASQTSLLLEY